MARFDEDNARLHPGLAARSASLFLMVLLVLLVLAATDSRNRAADEPERSEPAHLSRQEALEQFRKMSPEQRLQWVEKTAGRGQPFVAVVCADLDVTVVERGTLDPSDASDIVCRIKARPGSISTASTIKWVIDEGTSVKKGQRLLELDDSGLRDQFRLQKIEVERSTGDRIAAEANLKVARAQNKLDTRTAEINVKLARLCLKKYTGDDTDEKERLELEVERARLNLETIKLQARAKEIMAEADVKAKAAVEEQQARTKRDIEADIEACVIKAPQAGLVLYHVPEVGRLGGKAILAQGESVREGQMLMRVCGLARFAVKTRVHEALIARVRTGQPASVRVDAFPDRLLRGRVKSIAAVAAPQDWLSADVKVYPVVVDVSDPLPGLKPGMTAEVRIEVERRAKVLRLPLEAVVRSGRDSVCYVKVGKGLQERKVTTGARNDLFIEIKEGLKEEELVLRSPRALPRSGSPRPPAKEGKKATAVSRSARILVQSVRPAALSTRRRTNLEPFGLTGRDLERIQSLPDVASVAPVRAFPAEAHHLERRQSVRVVGTVPAYRELAGLHLAAGRFLIDNDDVRMKNVAVLGAATAARLFAEEEAIGQTVRVGASFYVVVGVLRERDRPAAGLTADEVNRGVYLPLQTCQRRFGEVVLVRRAATWAREAVPLTEVLVSVRSDDRAPFVVRCVAALLEMSHPRKDWQVRSI